ncbi:FIST signal transduction protein [Fibrobacter sp. UBA4309]|uniref:FIST signal transduction protein n=1 Tax=Fibrobacter sp. UBA4309 TaxID=1946537 RepID=UPI0025C72312|nr:FIST N-terminal domain-containing protein [Fibrobacter sp. UBA4309]
MIRKVFNYSGIDGLKRDLLALKDSDDLKNVKNMYFQIYSTVLDEEKLQPIFDTLTEIFPDVPWMGNSTSGNIIDSEQAGDIVITATLFQDFSTEFRLFQYDMQKMSIDEISQDVLEQAKNNPWVKGVEIYYTISNVSTTRFCDALKELAPGIQVFGGIVCSPDLMSPNSFVFSSVGGLCRSGILVAFFGGINFYVNSIKISGWQPLGRTFRVTRASGNIVYELDGRPAFEVYHKYLSIANDENFFMNALEFPMLYEHNKTTIVRAPAECRFDGSLVMSSDVDVGSVVHISYGEPNTIVECISEESKKIDRFYPEVIHIFDCAARKAFWSSHEPTYEIYALKKIAPNNGFFSHGEFLREEGCLNQHNITLVMAGMREGEPHVNGRQWSQLLDEQSTPKIPLAARMATFIKEASKDLEDTNRKLQQMNERLQKMAGEKEN